MVTKVSGDVLSGPKASVSVRGHSRDRLVLTARQALFESSWFWSVLQTSVGSRQLLPVGGASVQLLRPWRSREPHLHQSSPADPQRPVHHLLPLPLLKQRPLLDALRDWKKDPPCAVKKLKYICNICNICRNTTLVHKDLTVLMMTFFQVDFLTSKSTSVFREMKQIYIHVTMIQVNEIF